MPTALFAAVQAGHRDIVKLLIARGADVAIKNYRGETVLWYALKNKQLDILKILLESGIEVNNGPGSPLDAIADQAKEGTLDSLKAWEFTALLATLKLHA